MVRNGATFFINILKILQKYIKTCILIECGASLSARTAGGVKFERKDKDRKQVSVYEEQ